MNMQIAAQGTLRRKGKKKVEGPISTEESRVPPRGWRKCSVAIQWAGVTWRLVSCSFANGRCALVSSRCPVVFQSWWPRYTARWSVQCCAQFFCDSPCDETALWSVVKIRAATLTNWNWRAEHAPTLAVCVITGRAKTRIVTFHIHFENESWASEFAVQFSIFRQRRYGPKLPRDIHITGPSRGPGECPRQAGHTTESSHCLEVITGEPESPHSPPADTSPTTDNCWPHSFSPSFFLN